ncbi:MAG: HAD family hydrolase [Pirellulaceae bacterium]
MGFAPEHVLVAGDSGNDEGMLLGRTLGVVVGNYSPELGCRNRPRVYFAQGHHAWNHRRHQLLSVLGGYRDTQR